MDRPKREADDPKDDRPMKSLHLMIDKTQRILYAKRNLISPPIYIPEQNRKRKFELPKLHDLSIVKRFYDAINYCLKYQVQTYAPRPTDDEIAEYNRLYPQEPSFLICFN